MAETCILSSKISALLLKPLFVVMISDIRS